MSGGEVLAVCYFVVGLGFPLGYAFALRINNAVLFLMASYGAEAVVFSLAFLAAAPLTVLMVFAYSQFVDVGIEFPAVARVADFVAVNAEFAGPAIAPVASVLLRRRYGGLFEARRGRAEPQVDSGSTARQSGAPE